MLVGFVGVIVDRDVNPESSHQDQAEGDVLKASRGEDGGN